MYDKNCLSYWFPLLEAAALPMPRTRIVPMRLPLSELCAGRRPEQFASFLDFVGELEAAAHSLGGYPIFLRTGHGSGKHNWVRTCYVGCAADIPAHVVALVEWSELVDIVGLPTNVWAVREFLHLDAPFRAFGGFPVARERRFFARGGKVICQHPYWPEDALSVWGEKNLPLDWRKQLASLNGERPGERSILAALARRASLLLPGAWSIDFSCGADGRWWLTDCALAARSFHWPDCPHAGEVNADGV